MLKCLKRPPSELLAMLEIDSLGCLDWYEAMVVKTEASHGELVNPPRVLSEDFERCQLTHGP